MATSLPHPAAARRQRIYFQIEHLWLARPFIIQRLFPFSQSQFGSASAGPGGAPVVTLAKKELMKRSLSVRAVPGTDNGLSANPHPAQCFLPPPSSGL